MHLLYPSDPFDRKQPDEDYHDEFVAARAAGLDCVLFSVEDFRSGTFKSHSAGALQGDVLYRGWMLAPDDYERLCHAVEAAGARMRVGPPTSRGASTVRSFRSISCATAADDCVSSNSVTVRYPTGRNGPHRHSRGCFGCLRAAASIRGRTGTYNMALCQPR